jgi:hypothetical protein
MEVLYTMGKGTHLNPIQKFCIYKEIKKAITSLITNILENKRHTQSLTPTRSITQRH